MLNSLWNVWKQIGHVGFGSLEPVSLALTVVEPVETGFELVVTGLEEVVTGFEEVETIFLSSKISSSLMPSCSISCKDKDLGFVNLEK